MGLCDLASGGEAKAGCEGGAGDPVEEAEQGGEGGAPAAVEEAEGVGNMSNILIPCFLLRGSYHK